jgi:hypothetical protein
MRNAFALLDALIMTWFAEKKLTIAEILLKVVIQVARRMLVIEGQFMGNQGATSIETSSNTVSSTFCGIVKSSLQYEHLRVFSA